MFVCWDVCSEAGGVRRASLTDVYDRGRVASVLGVVLFGQEVGDIR